MKSFLSFTKWDLYAALLAMSAVLTTDLMDKDGWEGFFRACILGAIIGIAWAVGGFYALDKLNKQFERPSIH